MKLISMSYNEYRGIGKTNRISWEDFQIAVEISRNWKYDKTNKYFYFYANGKKQPISLFHIQILAASYGFYSPLGDYYIDS
jgi:hypothetical protein